MFTVSNRNNVYSILNNRCICITISCGGESRMEALNSCTCTFPLKCILPLKFLHAYISSQILACWLWILARAHFLITKWWNITIYIYIHIHRERERERVSLYLSLSLSLSLEREREREREIVLILLPLSSSYRGPRGLAPEAGGRPAVVHKLLLLIAIITNSY